MDALEFINQFDNFLQEIEDALKPDLLQTLQELKETDPHDLISPYNWFVSKNHARGLVWSLFLIKCENKKT